MSPTISIGIPTYEMKGSGPLYLSHLLETIRGQKFTTLRFVSQIIQRMMRSLMFVVSIKLLHCKVFQERREQR